MDFRDIFIMRHAKSDWQIGAISDIDRPLNKRGLRDSPRMADWMILENLKPNLLISSPALRARQTASVIIDHLNIEDSSVVVDKRMYLASVDTLLTIIRQIDDKHQTIMLVGHNPGLENLAMRLSIDELPTQSDGSLLTTANFVQLRLNKSWQELQDSDAQFIQLMRPRQLP